MNFIFPWLLWRRAARKQEEKNAKIFEELGNNKVIAELSERDPEVREALRTRGVKAPPQGGAMNPTKPECPDHKTEMRYAASNFDQSEQIILRGKKIENKFYYCGEGTCDWRYSSDLGDYFKAEELPSSKPKSGLPPLTSRR